MASTGTALFLSLQARTEQLEKDLAKAKGQVKDFARGVSKDAEGAAGFMEKIGLSGESAKRAFQNLAGGLMLAAGQVDGVGEKAQALTQTFGAFLTGGPIAGGIVGLTSLFKFLASDIGGVDEAAKRAGESTEKFLKDAKTTADAAEKSMDALFRKLQSMRLAAIGVTMSVDEIALNAERTQAERQRDRLLSTIRAVYDAGGGADMDQYKQLTRFAQEATALAERIEQIDRQLALMKEVRAEEEKAAKSKEEQEKSAKAIESAEAERVKLMNEAVAAANKLHVAEDAYLDDLDRRKNLDKLGPGRAGATFNEATGVTVAPVVVPKSVVVKAEKAGRDIGEHITKGIGEAVQTELPRTLDPIFEQLGQTAFSGLGDALFDAITTGGKNASEIFQQTINSMLRQVINSILNSGLQMLLASIGGGGGGGGGGVLSSVMSFIPGLGGGDAVAGSAGLAGLADT